MLKNKIEDFFKTKDLKKAISKAIENDKTSEVFKFELDEKSYWIKRARPSDSSFFHRVFYSLFKMKGMMPAQKKTKEETVYFEVNKLIYFKSLNIPVPEVVACNKEFFVIEDSGTTIRDYVKKTNLTDTQLNEVLGKTVQLIATIHNKSQYHGGSQIRNYTIKDGMIFAIDFEDSFSDKHELKQLQYRDFFLFLVSLSELKREIDYSKIINIYKELTNNTTIDKELKTIALRLNFLVKLIEFKPLRKYLSKDVIYNYNLVKALQNL